MRLWQRCYWAVVGVLGRFGTPPLPHLKFRCVKWKSFSRQLKLLNDAVGSRSSHVLRCLRHSGQGLNYFHPRSNLLALISPCINVTCREYHKNWQLAFIVQSGHSIIRKCQTKSEFLFSSCCKVVCISFPAFVEASNYTHEPRRCTRKCLHRLLLL